MDFHDKMCILVENFDEAFQICQMLDEANIKWVSGNVASELVTFRDPGVYYVISQGIRVNPVIWWHLASGAQQRRIMEDVAMGALEPPVRFCDLFHTRVSIPTVDDLL